MLGVLKDLEAIAQDDQSDRLATTIWLVRSTYDALSSLVLGNHAAVSQLRWERLNRLREEYERQTEKVAKAGGSVLIEEDMYQG